MNSVKRVLLGLALAGLVVAQAPPATQSAPYQSRVIQVKYADVRDLANVLSVFGVGIKANPDLRVLAVSAPTEVMNAIEDAVKRLDVPTAAPKDVNLTAYLVVASQQAEPSSVPRELEAVTKELRDIFAYKSFRMLDSILLRTQPGTAAHAKGLIAGPENSRTPYEFTVRPASVMDDPAGRLIRLDILNLSMRVNTPNSGDKDAGITTEITVREGQKVVVGKSNMGAPDQALVLVVTAKVAE